MHFNCPEATAVFSGASMTTLASRGQYDAGDLSCAAGGSAEETGLRRPFPACLTLTQTVLCPAMPLFFNL